MVVFTRFQFCQNIQDLIHQDIILTLDNSSLHPLTSRHNSTPTLHFGDEWSFLVSPPPSKIFHFQLTLALESSINSIHLQSSNKIFSLAKTHRSDKLVFSISFQRRSTINNVFSLTISSRGKI